MASILLDEGFGSFDRCSMLIRCLRGDMEKAREVLSKLIISEAQLKQEWVVESRILFLVIYR